MKWLRQMKGLKNEKNDRNVYLERFGALFILAILTFAIPLLQWLADKLIKSSGYSTLAGNLLTIAVFGYWSLQNNLFDYFPTIPVGRTIVCFLWITLLILLFLNLQHRPVSGITGQVRSPYEVVDVIILGSMAEELVFRGAMWSLLNRLSRWESRGSTALVGTSILFGMGHLGYWARSGWPLLSPDAYMHVVLMIFAGGFFGSFRLKTKSLTVPMSIYMLSNGIILLSQ